MLDYVLDFSVLNYQESLAEQFQNLGIELVRFTPKQNPPRDVAVYWDPRLAGGTPPWHTLLQEAIPVVATLYDAAPWGLPPWEYYSDMRSFRKGYAGMVKRLYAWHRRWSGRCAAIITISDFSRHELRSRMGLWSENIVTVPLGVDSKRFCPAEHPPPNGAPYLLHVSQYQPKKNVDRLLVAYANVSSPSKPRLVVVASGYPMDRRVPEGVELVRDPVSEERLRILYQGALAFLFPSLHEGFGLPILEAMASGTPVLTSNQTACPETAGGAAFLVNPRSIPEITTGIERLVNDGDMRDLLRRKGLKRAATMSWSASASMHARVFEEAASFARRS